MINTVIFDIGNVLAFFCWEEVFKKVFAKEDLQTAVDLTIGDLDSWNYIDQGTKTFDEYIDFVGAKAPYLKEKFRESIIEIFQKIVPFPYATSWVKEMKDRGYNVYILSNYGELPFSLSKDRFDFLEHVDGKIISYEIKQIKPHNDIYYTLFQKFDIDPTKAVFIDDNVNNINAANKLGLSTVLFKDYEQGKAELEEILKNN